MRHTTCMYRPTEDVVPIEWHGAVKMLPEKKPGKSKKNGKGGGDGAAKH